MDAFTEAGISPHSVAWGRCLATHQSTALWVLLHIHTIWKRLQFQWHFRIVPPWPSCWLPSSLKPSLVLWCHPSSAWPSAWNLALSHLKISQSHKYSQIQLKTTPLSLSTQFYMKDKTGQKNFQIKKQYVLSVSLNVKFLQKEKTLS